MLFILFKSNLTLFLQIAFSTNVYVSQDFQPAITISGLHGKPQSSVSNSSAEVQFSIPLPPTCYGLMKHYARSEVRS